MKKGFTLVELSIVLVIIGLLIGGILVAQSMVKTAQINGVVREFQQYDIALSNFQTKFQKLPGDSAIFNNTGDDNQRIENNENANFWSDLSIGVDFKNIKNVPYLPRPGNGITPDYTYYPKLKITQNEKYGPAFVTVLYSGTTNSNVYRVRISYNNSVGNGQRYDPVMTSDALAIDQKLDDGKPITGNMIVNSNTMSPGSCNLAGVYNVAADNFNCTLNVKFGTMTGTTE